MAMDVSRGPRVSSPRHETHRVYGYEVRKPFASEKAYFKKNPQVSGMAAEDDRIILNPYSKLKPQERQAVLRNEAARIFMRQQNYNYDFDVTPEQAKSFAGTAYSQPANIQNLKSTILGRIISGDPSAGVVTPAQRMWADRIQQQLLQRGTP